MNIAVCVKSAIDTEAVVTLDAQGNVVTEGAAQIIEPYAEFAVERAIQLVEAQGGEVVLVCIGSADHDPALRHGLSMGAARAIRIDDERIDITNPEAKARVLQAALAGLDVDLIMGGTKSGDTANAQTLPRLGVLMGLPEVNLVVDLEVADGKALAGHETEDGTDTIEVPLPAIIAAQQGLAEPRYPKVPDIMKAKKKPIDVKTLDDLGVDVASVDASAAKTVVLSYALAQSRSGGRIIAGDAEEVVPQVAALLATEAKVL